MLKKYTPHIIFVLLISSLVFLFGFSKNRNQNKKVKGIEVVFEGDNNNYLTHSAVNKLLIQNQGTVQNQSKSIVDLHSLEGQVLSNPYVEKATVFLTVDGLLKTTIKQRKPIARIVNESGVYYVDKYGVKMPLSSNYSARVPMIYGISLQDDLKEITQLVTIITADDFLKKEIIAIKKNKLDEYLFKVRSGDYSIQFGKMKDAKLKFKKLKAFYNKAYVDKTINNYQLLNLKYQNQVVCVK